MPQAVNVIVDGRIFFDESIRGSNVCLRLVVVVVTHEVLHPIIGKELHHFLSQLCRQTFVGSQDQGWALGFFNSPGDRGTLA